MNVILYGRDSITEKASQALNGSGIRTTCLTPGTLLTDCEEKVRECQVALIDVEAENALTINRQARVLLGIPTVLLLDNQDDAWTRSDDFQPDGYILNSFSRKELAARLAAVVRLAAAHGAATK